MHGRIKSPNAARMRLETVPKCLSFWAVFFCATRSQGSSVVEQGTHKPLVGSSTLPPGMLSWNLSVSCLFPRVSWFSCDDFRFVVVLLLEGRASAHKSLRLFDLSNVSGASPAHSSTKTNLWLRTSA